MSEKTEPAEQVTINVSPPKFEGYPTEQAIELPMQAWVKGGTTSSRYDQEIKEIELDAEKRRLQADADRAMASVPIEQGGGKLYSHHFGHPVDDPKVLVKFVNSKKEVIWEMLCDIGVEFDGSSMWLVFPCPDCKSRGLPLGQCQIRVCDKHRSWHLDERTKGEPIVWDPGGPDEQVYYSAGKIMDTDILKCPNFGCQLEVKIHNNMMYRV